MSRSIFTIFIYAWTEARAQRWRICSTCYYRTSSINTHQLLCSPGASTSGGLAEGRLLIIQLSPAYSAATSRCGYSINWRQGENGEMGEGTTAETRKKDSKCTKTPESFLGTSKGPRDRTGLLLALYDERILAHLSNEWLAEELQKVAHLFPTHHVRVTRASPTGPLGCAPA